MLPQGQEGWCGWEQGQAGVMASDTAQGFLNQPGQQGRDVVELSKISGHSALGFGPCLGSPSGHDVTKNVAHTCL